MSSDGGSPITIYRVYRSTRSGQETFLADARSGSSFDDTSAVPGTRYYYKTTAVNAVGESARSNEVTVQAPTVPGAPGNPSFKPNEPAGIVVTWSPPSSTGNAPITGYRIYRATASRAETLVATVDEETSWTDTDVSNGGTYYYQVSAVNAVGEGKLSSEKSTKRGTAPSAPRNFQVSASSKGGVALQWSAPSSNGGANVTGYRIFRGTTSGAETLLATVGSVTTFVDSSTRSGTRFYYWVTAVNLLGEGAVSNEASAVAK